MSGDYRSSHLAKGEDYDRIFRERPREASMWRLERRVLLKVLHERYNDIPPSHLDFACGTGRVLAFLQPHASTSVGVDVSPTMLKVATVRAPRSKTVLADITRTDALEGSEFDLITAFRFFPNAEPSLRFEAMTTLRGLLSARGLIVVNNHLNGGSSLRRFQSARGRPTGHSMDHAEMEQLCHAADLEIVQSLGLGLLPVGSGRRRSERVLIYLDKRVHKGTRLSQLCENVIYVLAPRCSSSARSA